MDLMYIIGKQVLQRRHLSTNMNCIAIVVAYFAVDSYELSARLAIVTPKIPFQFDFSLKCSYRYFINNTIVKIAI